MPGAVWFTALCTLGGTHVEDGVGGLAAQLDGGLDLYRMHGSRTFHEALHQEAIMWYHDVAPRLHRPEPSRLISTAQWRASLHQTSCAVGGSEATFVPTMGWLRLIWPCPEWTGRFPALHALSTAA